MRTRFLIPVVAIIMAFLLAGNVAGQGDFNAQFNLTLYEANPILAPSGAGWDADIVWYPQVIYHDGLFHMFYTGGGGQIADVHAIGYATSEDGVNWTRYANNPVVEFDESLGQYGCVVEDIMLQGDTWVMFLAAREAGNVSTNWDTALLRATAPAPTGPWTVETTPILEAGERYAWDDRGIILGTVMEVDGEYRLYYLNEDLDGIGLATSADGLTWTKYNDPATTYTKYLASDPVLEASFPTTLFWIGDFTVRKRGETWDLFFTWGDLRGGSAIGYATSADGIAWTLHPDNPILQTPGVELPILSSVVVVDDVYYMYYTAWDEWHIDMATGTVTWE